MDVITYPWWDQSGTMLVKGAPDYPGWLALMDLDVKLDLMLVT